VFEFLWLCVSGWPAAVSLAVERFLSAIALDVHLEDLGVVNEAVDGGGRHRLMGGLLINTNRAQRGIEEFERALALDPNHARARAAIGLAQLYIGRAEETEAHVLEALRLSPRDFRISHWFLHVGGAKACLGEHAAAVGWLRRSIDANRNNPWAHFYLAACLAHLGRIDEARLEVNAGLAVNPKFTIRRFRGRAKPTQSVAAFRPRPQSCQPSRQCAAIDSLARRERELRRSPS
jgi:tetratricopeptide (TPR) repeat protein